MSGATSQGAANSVLKLRCTELRYTTELSNLQASAHEVVDRARQDAVLRSHPPARAEVFASGTIGAMGDVPESLVSISTAEAMALLWENAYCAEMKKLMRLLIAAHYLPPTQSSASSSSSGSFDIVVSGGDGRSCAQCLKVPVAKFVAISSRPKQCALCMARVSSNCRVKKTMGFPSAANHAKKMAKLKRNICMQCIPRVSNSSSAVFTALDARAARRETVDYIGTLKFVLGCHGR